MLKSVKASIQNAYRQYKLVTCLEDFEPWEKNLINGFMALIFGLIIFSSCVYLPSYIQTFLQFISPLDAKANSAPYAPMMQTEKIS